MNVTFFGYRAFIDVIKMRSLRLDYSDRAGVLVRREETHREDSRVTRDAETEVTWLRARDSEACWLPPKPGRGTRFLGACGPADCILDF